MKILIYPRTLSRKKQRCDILIIEPEDGAARLVGAVTLRRNEPLSKVRIRIDKADVPGLRTVHYRFVMSSGYIIAQAEETSRLAFSSTTNNGLVLCALRAKHLEQSVVTNKYRIVVINSVSKQIARVGDTCLLRNANFADARKAIGNFALRSGCEEIPSNYTFIDSKGRPIVREQEGDLFVAEFVGEHGAITLSDVQNADARQFTLLALNSGGADWNTSFYEFIESIAGSDAENLMDIFEDTSHIIPAAAPVVMLCRRILEQFQDKRKFKREVEMILKFAVKLALLIEKTSASPAFKHVEWSYIEQNLKEARELLNIIQRRGKLGHWIHGQTDQNELCEILTRVERELPTDEAVNNDVVRPCDVEALEIDDFVRLNVENAVHDMSLSESIRKCIGIKSEDFNMELLQECLYPLQVLDDILIDEHIARYLKGTRVWAFECFDQWLLTGTKHRVLVLAAGAGLGKTTIASKLVRDRPDVVAAYHFCRHDDPVRSNTKNMLMSLAFQLACKIPNYGYQVQSHIRANKLTRPILVSDKYSTMSLFTEFFQVPLQAIPEQKKTVLLIDALDECCLSADGSNGILQCIQKHFSKLPEWLCLYVTTRPEIPIIEKLKIFSPWVVQPDDESNLNDLRLFFSHVLETCRFSNKLDDGTEECFAWNEKGAVLQTAVDALVTKSRGLFIYATFVAEQVKEMGQRYVDCLCLDDLPDGLDGYYDEQMQRILSSADAGCKGELLEWQIVKIVIAAAEPIHVKLVEALTECSEKERKRAINNLSTLFPVRDRKLHVYHKSLKDWLVKETRADEENFVDLAQIHRFMGVRCLDLMKHSGVTGKIMCTQGHSHEIKDYCLNNAISHFLQAGMVMEARTLFLDVGWLTGRAQAGQALGIVKDNAAIQQKGKDLTAELVAQAVGLSLHALRKDWRQLAGQLVGRLFSSTRKGISSSDVVDEIQDFLVRVKQYNHGFSWYCPISATWEQAGDICLKNFTGHRGPVYSVTWSHNGKKLASGSKDKSVRVWDVMTGDCELMLQGHAHFVTAVAFSPVDDRLISASCQAKEVWIWDVESGAIEKRLDDHISCVSTVSWSPNAKHIATCSGGKRENAIRVWDPSTGRCEKVVDGGAATFSTLIWLTCQNIASSDGRTLQVWNVQSVECKLSFETYPSGGITTLAPSVDGNRIATGSRDGTIGVWLISSGTCATNNTKIDGAVCSICWSPCDNIILIGSHNGKIHFFDPDGGVRVQVFAWGQYPVYSVAFSPDGLYFAAASSNWRIKILDRIAAHERSNGSARTRSKRFLVGARGMISWSPDGKHVASAGIPSFHSVRVWDPASGKCLQYMKADNTRLRSLSWSPCGKKILASAGKAIQIWDWKLGELEKVLTGHTARVQFAEWSWDEDRIASASFDKSIRVWDAESGMCKCIGEGHTGFVYFSRWSPDCSRLFSGSEDKTARVWDANSGASLSLFCGHQGAVKFGVWSCDGSRVLCVSRNISEWSILDECCLRVFHTEGAKMVRDIPDFPFPSIMDIYQNISIAPRSEGPVGIDGGSVKICDGVACAYGLSDQRPVSFFHLVESSHQTKTCDFHGFAGASDMLVADSEGSFECYNSPRNTASNYVSTGPASMNEGTKIGLRHVLEDQFLTKAKANLGVIPKNERGPDSKLLVLDNYESGNSSDRQIEVGETGRRSDDVIMPHENKEAQEHANQSIVLDSSTLPVSPDESTTTIESVDEGLVCVVCEENPRKTLIIPCRHLCLCSDCAKLKGMTFCPLCRGEIESTVNVFL